MDAPLAPRRRSSPTIAILLGTILAFGRLSGDSEHIALYASGVSFFRIARPVAWLGLIVGVITLFWNESVVPPATRELYKVMANAVEDVNAVAKPLRYDIKEKGKDRIEQFVSIDGGYDAKTKSLIRVTILRFDKSGKPSIMVYADRAIARDTTGTNWTFYDANLEPVGQPVTGRSTYDPRNRPWYIARGADKGPVMT